MTDPSHKARKPGRPRSEKSRQAILAATRRLLAKKPVRSMTIEGIAKEAGVGKPTIYRWWDSKCALVMDAFLDDFAPQVPITENGSAIAALVGQVKLVIELLRGRSGRIVADMIGEGQADPHVLDEFRERFFAQLLAPARAVIERGKETGEIHKDIEADLALDMIYGPIYYRLLVGHRPLDDDFARSLAKRIGPALGATQAEPAP